MSTIPLCATTEYVCLADENHVSVLAAASLRQLASLDVAASTATSTSSAAAAIVALFVDPATSAITTVDVDGVVATRTPDQQHRRAATAAVTAGASSVMRYTHLLTASAAGSKNKKSKDDDDSDVSVVAATIARPAAGAESLFGEAMPPASAFFVPADNLLGKQARALAQSFGAGDGVQQQQQQQEPLVVAALLSDGTVVHGQLSLSKPVPAIGVAQQQQQQQQQRVSGNILFAASPSQPLAVTARYGASVLSVFWRDPAAAKTLIGSGDAAAADASEGPAAAATAAASRKKKPSAKAKRDDDDDGGASAAVVPSVATAVTIATPVAIASIAVHPTRHSVALGGVRGEIVVIHNILAFSGMPSGGSRAFFSDHWHHTPLTSLCFAGGPDGPILLSGASEGCLCVWNVGANYARSNISLGTGISEVARVSAIVLAADEPSKCVVCIGDGDVQLALVDLSHRRLVARRDGLTAGGGSTASSGGAAAFGDESAIQIAGPVQWMGGAAVPAALFLYGRRSGRLRLYDPFERRSLRTSVLTASVETVPQPPTVGLQRLAATASGRRVAVFESSAEPVMPPALRWMVYDAGLRRFRQVQQAIDPHCGAAELTGMVWVQEARQQQQAAQLKQGADNDAAGATSKAETSNRTALITCSAGRIKVWMSAEDSQALSAGKKSRVKNGTVARRKAAATEAGLFGGDDDGEEGGGEADDYLLMMNCVADIVTQNHPVLSLVGPIRAAALSADHTVLFVAGDLVAAVDARHWFAASSKKTAAPPTSSSSSAAVVIAAPTPLGNNGLGGAAHTLVPLSTGGVAAAFPDAIAVFGMSGGSFRCRAVIRAGDHDAAAAAATSSVIAVAACPASAHVVALVRHERKSGKGNAARFQVLLIDAGATCSVLARAAWHRHYCPASSGSFALLSSVDAVESAATVAAASGAPAGSAWRCTVGVATLHRGFRTLSVAFNPRRTNAAGARAGADAAATTVAPAASSSVALAAAERFAAQEQISSFFRSFGDGAIAKSSGRASAGSSPYATDVVASSEQTLFATCAERVLTAKAAARYGIDVLNATTFFAAPSMSAVAASVFDRLESDS